MFKASDVVQLKDGEKIFAVVRRHGAVLLPRLLLSGLLIAIPFFFLFPLTRSGAGGIAAFVLCVAVGLVMALRSFLMWDSDVLLVTSERLIDVDQRGLWARIVAETPLRQVHEVVWLRKGVLGTFLRTGTLRVKSSSASDIVCPDLPHPERVSRLIEELCDRKSGHAAHHQSNDWQSVSHWIRQADRVALERAQIAIVDRLNELKRG